jgi:lipopolysaccharide assembly outer membrane protein LptD (OstA)
MRGGAMKVERKVISAGLLIVLIVLTLAASAAAQESGRVILEHADQVEVVLSDEDYLTYVVGNVIFKTETGRIYCDSAVWRKGKSVNLKGNVIVDDAKYRLTADSVFYDVATKQSLALGSNVELWSYQDSLYAAGVHAFFDNERNFFYMEKRPVVYLNYPDSSRMVEVIADYVEYDAASKRAEATGTVVITSQDVSSLSDCAVMHLKDNTLDLFGNPRAKHGDSEISGELISVMFDKGLLQTIDVIDSAVGEFTEPVDTAAGEYDRSTLKGKRIILNFKRGRLADVLCYGQAYSWYYPSTRNSDEYHENTVSGDTIRFTVENQRLKKVKVIGGAIGTYVTGPIPDEDTAAASNVDTINYNAQYIEYDLADSMITLHVASHVQSGKVSLDAHFILFDTDRRVIKAYSAQLDTVTAHPKHLDNDSTPEYSLQPNPIPVILRDKNEEVYGDYLEYSIDTEKGRIIQSKSKYEAGFYYGDKLFREQKHIFYVDGGRYTTCDKNEPHYHFHSKSMKLIEGDKLIARPVVFYLGRLPLLAIPYYVFPLRKGRHSGFLPFTFGNFERGERFVRDVGYYWAASEYWDWQGSFDYYELSHTITINSRVNFRKRYVLDGYLSGNYTRETYYNQGTASENKRTRWALNSIYNHTFSPSFNIRAFGSFQSDAQYYTDYSFNLEERLNRQVKSQLSFSKKFGTSASLSGNLTHYVDLDRESRTDNIPNMTLSLPTIWPFGSGSRNEQGQLEQKWYQNFTFRYNPSLINFSSRITLDSVFTAGIDTVFDTIYVDPGDSSIIEIDTTYNEIKDTLSYRSRKKYAKISHNPRISLPTITLFKYFIFTPSFNYNETWFKIFRTDQSDAAGIDASTIYRTYSYSGGLGLKTALYGTVYPNMLGIIGLRHVLTPTISYSYAPEIDRHPEVRAFAGGGAGSQKRQSLSFTLNQLFQAKVKQGDGEKSLDLLSLTSSFSYNLKNKERPLSDMRTTFHISSLPNITLSGSMNHTFYNPDKPESNELHFWSPYLMSFSFNANFKIAGSHFLFDDTIIVPPGGDSTSVSQGKKGWSLSATYSYQESGRGAQFRKSSFLRFTLGFNLTPSTSVTYSQQYDIVDKLTVSSSVNIVRQIHCWTGSLYWVPVGSNRGFGFKLFVTALPEIKIDNNHDLFSTTSLRPR